VWIVTPTCGPLAQLAEQQTLNLRVEGSIPSRLTIFSEQFFDFAYRFTVLEWLWLRLGCVSMCRRIVIESIDGGAIRTRNQVTVGVDGDLDVECPSWSFT